ncbi:unnamed protein product [Acanthosepion pharaonis]|uniref:DUF7041 domain-containing protein n=1 Tax=Acanthosepion pharaonis TaxID=158019 RepID=A0A812C9G4_ACAPH|nr:unnamed protein product [Sepia pharaonis]
MDTGKRLAEKMAEHTETEINTSAALIQLPPYNSINSRSWFIQLEAIFSARKVTRQDTKYASVVQALPASIVEEVEDILLNTPDQLPYTCLKEAILKRTGRSDEDLIRDLFSNVSLGDRTPSQLLRLMKIRLGNNTMAEPVLRGLWMDRLPPNITQVLALVPVETPLDVVADSADKIYSQAHQKVHQVESHGNHTQRLEEEMTQLRAELRDLKLSLCRRQRSPAPRTRNRSRTRSSSPGRRNSVDECWYHQTFGDRARKCHPPCRRNKAQGNE